MRAQGFRVRIRALASGFRVWGLGFRVLGLSQKTPNGAFPNSGYLIGARIMRNCSGLGSILGDVRSKRGQF